MPRISTDNYDTVASWNGSQDLFVVEQADGTKVATPEQVKQYVLGNSIDDIYSVMGQMGAKNLNPYPYNDTTRTVNGITFTDNGDGTITASGTASANATFNIRDIWTASDLVELLPNTIYAFSGCPVGGSVSTYLIQFVNEESNLSNKSWLDDTGTGGTITTTDVKRFVGARIVIQSGTVLSTPVTFKPMLRLASDTDNTYRPYAKTNKELTDEIGDLSQTGLTGDSVAAQLDAAKEQIAAKRSKSVSSSVIGNGVNVASATSANPYTTPHEGFVRFDGITCLCVNTYRMMKSSANADYKGMWLPKGASIYFADGTPNLAQWFNCSNE